MYAALLTFALCIPTAGPIVEKHQEYAKRRWEQTGEIHIENKTIPWHGWVYYPTRYYITIKKNGKVQIFNVEQSTYYRYKVGDYYDHNNKSKAGR